MRIAKVPVCPTCGETTGLFDIKDDRCRFCRAREKREQEVEAEQKHARLSDGAARILVTTEATSALAIKDRLGLVTGGCVFGMNIIKDLLTDVRDIVGGRSATLQKALREAQDAALTEMRIEAAKLNATAIVAISFTHTQMSAGAGGMIAVVATGTAVTLA